MPVYTDTNHLEFERWERRHGWFPRVLEAEYGEIPAPEEIPAAINWPLLLPAARRYDFEDVECGLVHVSETGGYACTVWDVSGEEDEPWAVFVVDDYGARLLPEYSLLDEDLSEQEREAALRRAADEIPVRAETGEFARTGTPLAIPRWLLPPADEDA